MSSDGVSQAVVRAVLRAGKGKATSIPSAVLPPADAIRQARVCARALGWDEGFLIFEVASHRVLIRPGRSVLPRTNNRLEDSTPR